MTEHLLASKVSCLYSLDYDQKNLMLKHLSVVSFDNYEKWIYLGMCMKNCNFDYQEWLFLNTKKEYLSTSEMDWGRFHNKKRNGMFYKSGLPSLIKFINEYYSMPILFFKYMPNGDLIITDSSSYCEEYPLSKEMLEEKRAADIDFKMPRNSKDKNKFINDWYLLENENNKEEYNPRLLNVTYLPISLLDKFPFSITKKKIVTEKKAHFYVTQKKPITFKVDSPSVLNGYCFKVLMGLLKLSYSYADYPARMRLTEGESVEQSDFLFTHRIDMIVKASGVVDNVRSRYTVANTLNILSQVTIDGESLFSVFEYNKENKSYTINWNEKYNQDFINKRYMFFKTTHLNYLEDDVELFTFVYYLWQTHKISKGRTRWFNPIGDDVPFSLDSLHYFLGSSSTDMEYFKSLVERVLNNFKSYGFLSRYKYFYKKHKDEFYETNLQIKIFYTEEQFFFLFQSGNYPSADRRREDVVKVYKLAKKIKNKVVKSVLVKMARKEIIELHSFRKFYNSLRLIKKNYIEYITSNLGVSHNYLVSENCLSECSGGG